MNGRAMTGASGAGERAGTLSKGGAALLSGQVASEVLSRPSFRQQLLMPDYAGDIGAAWRVVEAMARRGYSVAIQCDGDRWACGFHSPTVSYCGKGATAPEAICHAALRVVRKQVTSRD